MIDVVFGGVFNPPTLAHYNACLMIQKAFDVRRFIFVPVGPHYIHKDVIDSTHRHQMVKLMAKELHAEVSTVELHATSFLGSYQTMKRLALTSAKFLLGSDNLAQFPQWLDAENLLREYGIIVIRRQQDIDAIIASSDMLSMYRHNITVIDEFDMPISSTMVRELKDHSLVIKAVADYIQTHQLYEEPHA
jgi:nicotinate-nucleotide adenylyltransferase